MVSFLPHEFPFRFVDNVILANTEQFITEKKSVIFNVTEPNFYYPKSLLIEHAAQTMYIHGYYIGLKNGWWNDSYRPVGFLTGINDAKFYNEKYVMNEMLFTRTEVLRICKPMFIVRSTVWKDGDKILFSGTINGVFTENVKCENSVADASVELSVDRVYCKRDEKGFYFDSNNWFLPGHFPDFSCYPGCLMLEGLAQTTKTDAQISQIKKIRFKKVMLPQNKYYYRKKQEQGAMLNFEIIEDQTNELCAEGTVEVF